MSKVTTRVCTVRDGGGDNRYALPNDQPLDSKKPRQAPMGGFSLTRWSRSHAHGDSGAFGASWWYDFAAFGRTVGLHAKK
jgi:hypothetical protein